MIAHVSVPVKDYKKAKKLYKAMLGAVGYEMTQDHPEWKAGGFREGGHTSFWIVQKEKMEPIHVAIIAPSKKAVYEFHERALEAGATDNGAPGFTIGPELAKVDEQLVASVFVRCETNYSGACEIGCEISFGEPFQ